MKILVISAPHTGTRFMGQMLGADRIHVFDHERLKVAIPRYTHLVSPLRDPKSIWQSYCSRFDTGHQVKHGMETLRDLLEYDVFFCPVDLGDRSEELGEYLGVEVTWGKEKTGHLPEKPLIPKDLGWAYELPFMKRFYD